MTVSRNILCVKHVTNEQMLEHVTKEQALNRQDYETLHFFITWLIIFPIFVTKLIDK